MVARAEGITPNPPNPELHPPTPNDLEMINYLLRRSNIQPIARQLTEWTGEGKSEVAMSMYGVTIMMVGEAQVVRLSLRAPLHGHSASLRVSNSTTSFEANWSGLVEDKLRISFCSREIETTTRLSNHSPIKVRVIQEFLQFSHNNEDYLLFKDGTIEKFEVPSKSTF